MDPLKILLRDKSNKTENEKGEGEEGRRLFLKSLRKALFKKSHFSFAVNTKIHDDFICAVPLRERAALEEAVRARAGRDGLGAS